MVEEDWNDDRMQCFGMLIDGRARPTGLPQRGVEATLLLVLNAHHDLVQFIVPAADEGAAWRLLIDTNVPEQDETHRFAGGSSYGVTGRSLLLFELAA
jgi:isoamylase